MKTRTSLQVWGWGTLLALAVTGCVRSHRYPEVVYTPPPPVVVAPTSDRTPVRVYPESSAAGPLVVPTPTSAADAADVAVAQTISQTFKNDPLLRGLTDNVRATVEDGVVTLSGTVPTDNDRRQIEDRVARMSGVAKVKNRLGLDLR